MIASYEDRNYGGDAIPGFVSTTVIGDRVISASQGLRDLDGQDVLDGDTQFLAGELADLILAYCGLLAGIDLCEFAPQKRILGYFDVPEPCSIDYVRFDEAWGGKKCGEIQNVVRENVFAPLGLERTSLSDFLAAPLNVSSGNSHEQTYKPQLSAYLLLGNEDSQVHLGPEHPFKYGTYRELDDFVTKAGLAPSELDVPLPNFKYRIWTTPRDYCKVFRALTDVDYGAKFGLSTSAIEELRRSGQELEAGVVRHCGYWESRGFYWTHSVPLGYTCFAASSANKNITSATFSNGHDDWIRLIELYRNTECLEFSDVISEFIVPDRFVFQDGKVSQPGKSEIRTSRSLKPYLATYRLEYEPDYLPPGPQKLEFKPFEDVGLLCVQDDLPCPPVCFFVARHSAGSSTEVYNFSDLDGDTYSEVRVGTSRIYRRVRVDSEKE